MKRSSTNNKSLRKSKAATRRGGKSKSSSHRQTRRSTNISRSQCIRNRKSRKISRSRRVVSTRNGTSHSGTTRHHPSAHRKCNARHQRVSKSRSRKSKRRPRRTSTSHKSARRVKRSLPPKTRIAVAVTPLRRPSSRPSLHGGLHGGSGRTNKKDYVAAALGVTALGATGLGATKWYLNKQQNDQKNAVEQTIKKLYARMLTAGFCTLVELCVQLWTLLQKTPCFSTAIQNYCAVLSDYVNMNTNSEIQHEIEIYMIHQRDLVPEQIITCENTMLTRGLREMAIKDLPHLARFGMLSTISPQMAHVIRKELTFWDKVENGKFINENFKTQLIATEWDLNVALMLLRDVAVTKLRKTNEQPDISEKLQHQIKKTISFIQSNNIKTKIDVYNAYVSCLNIFFLSHLSADIQFNVILNYTYNFKGANVYQLIVNMYKNAADDADAIFDL